MVKHPVILRGYYAATNDLSEPPLLVKRLDQEFVPGVLDGLRRKVTPDVLGKPAAAEDFRDGNLRLFQPVHRTFNLVVLEAVCRQPGFPRLDPRDIASAGFVVRRRFGGKDEGWLLRDDRVIGWNEPNEPLLDPDPRQRRPRLNAGHPHINGKLARLHEDLEPAAERSAPLFVAPPEVCAEAGRTLLYGLIPVTSSERSEATQAEKVDAATLAGSMPSFLLGPGNDVWPDFGPNQQDFPNGQITFEKVNEFIATDPLHFLTRLTQSLRLMHFGWRAFDSAVLMPLLNKVTLGFPNDRTEPLGNYLSLLTRRFVLRTEAADPVDLPTAWPQPSAELAAQIRAVVSPILDARLNEGVPNQQRFDEPDALYRLHAFVRVRCDDGCPPALHWSEPSAFFKIVPWWESGGGPLHTIELPDFTRDTVKNIKPNVAFKVPPRLAALLNQPPKNFLDGKAEDQGIGIAWICSLSIPIITLCAFIVLSIFLVLLHIAFWWLFYIKICLPFPKKN